MSTKRKPPSMRQQRDAALYQLGIDPKNAELHHTPPLAMRDSRIDPFGGKEYSPAENDPHYMIWMTKTAHSRQTYGVPATTAGSDIHGIAKGKRMKRKEALREMPEKGKAWFKKAKLVLPKGKQPLLRRKLYEKGTAK